VVSLDRGILMLSNQLLASVRVMREKRILLVESPLCILSFMEGHERETARDVIVLLANPYHSCNQSYILHTPFV